MAVPDVTFRLALVPGVTPTGWLRTWGERLPDVRLELVRVEAAEQLAALRDGRADAGLLRWPVADAGDDLSAIPLFTETTVLVVPRDHLLTALDEAGAADLADEVLLVPRDDVVGWADPPGRPAVGAPPGTTAEAVELVAAGVGVLVVPQSLARLHHRKDLTSVPMTDAPTSGVALVWVTERHGELVEELIGIVRGRTVNSSRGRGAPQAGPDPAPAGATPRQVTRRPAPRRAGTRRAGGSASGGRRTGR